jgi:CheY-like chemotaxis protein
MMNHGRIFYVDDNPKSRRLLTSVIKSCGFEVISAGDPMESGNVLSIWPCSIIRCHI